MITLTPDDVKNRFGPLFSKKFPVMVDGRAGIAEIIEQCGIAFPHDSPVFKSVKTDIVTLEQAEREAQVMGIRFLDRNGRKGRIGALGAVLWGNRGIEAAGLYGESL